MANRGFSIRGLSEFAIQTTNLDAMVGFYGDMLGLEHFATRNERNIVFFKVSDGFGGLTAVIALFGTDDPVVSGRGGAGEASAALHHIALAVSREEQDAAETWFKDNGIDTRIEEFAWVGWRGLFVKDPDGNTVELVAHDPSVFEPGT